MKANVDIKEFGKNCIEVLGIKYYSESYMKEMMSREYFNGLKEGTTIHIAETVLINKDES